MSVHLQSLPRHGPTLENIRTTSLIGFKPAVFDHSVAGTSVPHTGLPPPVSTSLARGSHSPAPHPALFESQMPGCPVKPL